MIAKIAGFSAMIAMTSVNAQIPVQKQPEIWVSEVKMDTTKPVPAVLPEKKISIKVEKPKEEQKVRATPIVSRKRIVVARERSYKLTPSVPKSAVKQYAKRRSDAKFGPGHYAALEALWTRESGWNYRSANPSSGACGIPQANPCSKAGGDYRTNPYTQVEWGLKYIAGRYGSPSNAWAFFQSHHWY